MNDWIIHFEPIFYRSDTSGDVSNKQISNLKRFGGFQALHQLGEVDDDDGEDENSERGNRNSLHLEDLHTERSLANRTLDQTIDEVEVDIEKVNGSFGFSIQVTNKLIHTVDIRITLFGCVRVGKSHILTYCKLIITSYSNPVFLGIFLVCLYCARNITRFWCTASTLYRHPFNAMHCIYYVKNGLA